MHVWRRKFVLYTMKYLQNEARKQKPVKEVTLQFSMIFQIRLNITTSFLSHMPFKHDYWSCWPVTPGLKAFTRPVTQEFFILILIYLSFEEHILNLELSS
jgi:hypothetical protein